ncbi:MAG: N-(5'-phosphoribosyl)anthranilate isomerase [Alphaproteobacteria bacterium]|nr:N-(5'-phosphoribosyl)anthranilate isomerase [Alphaproteobacteria bacterium]
MGRPGSGLASYQSTIIKICGLRTAADAKAARDAGADIVGFVVVEGATRAVPVDKLAFIASDLRKAGAKKVGDAVRIAALTVNADDELIQSISPLVDILQLHGDETPDRAAAIGLATGLAVAKAIGVAGQDDLRRAAAYAGHVDFLVLDSAPSSDGPERGGLGRGFDWSLLDEYRGEAPFLLAGGLTRANVRGAVAAAARNAKFSGVDVSSGVERERGVKDAELMRAFVDAARRPGERGPS